MPYEGLCVGGPMEGDLLTSAVPHHQVAEPELLDAAMAFDDAISQGTVKTGIYEFIDGAWHWNGGGPYLRGMKRTAGGTTRGGQVAT